MLITDPCFVILVMYRPVRDFIKHTLYVLELKKITLPNYLHNIRENDLRHSYFRYFNYLYIVRHWRFILVVQHSVRSEIEYVYNNIQGNAFRQPSVSEIIILVPMLQSKNVSARRRLIFCVWNIGTCKKKENKALN